MRIKRDYMGNDQLIPAYNFQAAISFLASGSLLAVFFHIFFEACNLPGKGLSVCISQGRCQSCHILFNLGRVIRNIQGKIAECAYLLKIQIRIRLLMAVSAHFFTIIERYFLYLMRKDGQPVNPMEYMTEE